MHTGNFYTRMAAFILTVILLGSLLCPANAIGQHASMRAAAVRLDAVPQAGWQKTAAFPDWSTWLEKKKPYKFKLKSKADILESLGDRHRLTHSHGRSVR